jgi:hypothetical protein
MHLPQIAPDLPEPRHPGAARRHEPRRRVVRDGAGLMR